MNIERKSWVLRVSGVFFTPYKTRYAKHNPRIWKKRGPERLDFMQKNWGGGEREGGIERTSTRLQRSGK